ncbi:peptidoglycan editing factor PgeF [Thermosyntropha sp.]|uniref:peptidoglycan editing factor PgeF n=1 Tax=Thermosyntropha sp. TaxID=2740820 RepID=UPI0025FD70C2|nr:peptidoglycan editing factor PgeF [Thermosyntropha sp.]MBO8158584.1 peptidoglycan editing factor PgeF [Thermosyntropha sp.]
MKKWIWHNEGELSYITLPEWEKKGVKALFSTRKGGVSKGPFSSLNVGLHVGDEEVYVLENRRKILNLLGAKLDNVVCCEQVHGDRIAVIGKDHKGCGAFSLKTALPGYDAMITNVSDIFLMAFYADCYSIYFFDPVKYVVGLAHSGWKGTALRIACKTVDKMADVFKSNPSDIEVFIGPGIKECCFKISPELAKQMKQEFDDFDNIITDKEGSIYWDLTETNRRLLVEYGIKPENIVICDLCTLCNENKFFSYRRDNGITGRMAAVIGLKE